jgi:hypothetical protein
MAGQVRSPNKFYSRGHCYPPLLGGEGRGEGERLNILGPACPGARAVPARSAPLDLNA